MIEPTGQATYAANLVAGLADTGIDVAFISPGSRNTPLTLAFAHEPRIRDISIRDERSGGFAALGYAKATGVPAVVVCTSGSAATHYMPAIVEADQSSTPLVVLTADRPARLRGTGAPQTMDQVDLYGNHVVLFTDIDTHDPATAWVDAAMLVTAAMSMPRGPVHGNLPFDEPLVPGTRVEVPDPQPFDPAPIRPAPEAEIGSLLEGRRTMIVVGGRGGPALGRAVSRLADHIAAPVFADPQTNISGPSTLRYGDLLVAARDDDQRPIAIEGHPPEVVLRLGPIPTSKPMWAWLETSGITQILIDGSRLADPLASATVTIGGDPLAVLDAMDLHENADRSFLEDWLAMDRITAATVEASVGALPFPNEPAIARAIAESVPDHSILFVGSSRPIRDIDAYAEPRPTVTIVANRGVNGIDGAVSTALGIALTGSPTTVLIGDVTALHDISALTEVARLGVPLRVVIVNNDGGGIFSFLPQARPEAVEPAVYERHWGTPHGLSVARIAESMGMTSRTVTTIGDLEAGVAAPIEAPELLEILTDRRDNLAHHQVVATAVARALAGGEKVEKRP